MLSPTARSGTLASRVDHGSTHCLSRRPPVNPSFLVHDGSASNHRQVARAKYWQSCCSHDCRVDARLVSRQHAQGQRERRGRMGCRISLRWKVTIIVCVSDATKTRTALVARLNVRRHLTDSKSGLRFRHAARGTASPHVIAEPLAEGLEQRQSRHARHDGHAVPREGPITRKNGVFFVVGSPRVATHIASSARACRHATPHWHDSATAARQRARGRDATGRPGGCGPRGGWGGDAHGHKGARERARCGILVVNGGEVRAEQKPRHVRLYHCAGMCDRQ